MLLVLSGVAAAGLSACGRRGPLEPPPYTAQGREWNRRQGRNPDGTPRKAGDQQPAQGSVSEAIRNDDDQRGTVDVEGEVERNRTEGEPGVPSDPLTTEPGQTTTPSVSPAGSRRRPPGVVPPQRAFVLDPLLE
jgi:predicted small lipoprotein YifL